MNRAIGNRTDFNIRPWHHAACILLLLLLAVLIYGPALRGGFVYDDTSLPFSKLDSQDEPLSNWLTGVRPVLMASYWLNYELATLDPFPYHFTNLIIHVLCTWLAFLILSKILEFVEMEAHSRLLLAAFAAMLFFAHPLQAESVDYIAGRSESLSGLFTLGAWAIFLYRREQSISWRDSCLVLVLFLLAVATKENAIALAPLLLLTDYFWSGRSFQATVRANWRLYSLLGLGALLALAFVLKMLSHAESAGFGISQFTWYQYFFTECRAVAGYIFLFLLPVGQTADHDFPASQTIFSHGALVYLIALATLAVLAFAYRKIFPLACFGLLMFLVLLAPTSSVVPILDPFVERRMYLPILGLLISSLEFLRRRDLNSISWRVALASLFLLAAFASHRQALIWSTPWTVWTNAIKESPNKARVYSGLAATALQEHRCQEAVLYIERAAKVLSKDPTLLLAWAKVLECVGKREDALQKVQEAATISPVSGTFELLGLLYGEMGKLGFSKQALDQAVKLDPSSASAHSARAIWFYEQGQLDEAAAEFRAAQQLNPRDASTRHYLWRLNTPRSYGK